MNGNSLICWTPALNCYTTAQLSVDVIWQAFSRHYAVQTFIYQFVVLNKINRLTLKRFEQKYLLLSGFTLEFVQISPANTLYSIHV